MGKIKVSDLPDFDPAEYLGDSESVAAYLNGVLEAHDPSLLASALGDVARARGMTQMAEASGVSREALYKALRPGANPRFETINRVCHALGLKIVVVPDANDTSYALAM